MSKIWYNHSLIVVGDVITHKMFDTWTKHLSATDGHLNVFLGPCGWRNSIFKSPSCTFTSVAMPTHQIYRRYNWHMKITWCFSYLFLWSMICWNQIEETLYPHLWVCKQFCCKILVQNSGYSLFQTWSLTLQSNPPGLHKHWSFFPDLHRKMWKEFLLHIDQAFIGSSKFGHVRVFVNYISQHNIWQIPQHHRMMSRHN